MNDSFICLTPQCQQQRIIKSKSQFRNHAKHLIRPYEAFKQLISQNQEISSKVMLWKNFDGLENYFKATIRKLKNHLKQDQYLFLNISLRVDEQIMNVHSFIMNNQFDKLTSDMINFMAEHLSENQSKVVEEEIGTINEIQEKIKEIVNEFGFSDKPEELQPQAQEFSEKRFCFSLSGKFLFDWDTYKNSVKERPILDIYKLKEEIKKEKNLTTIDLNLKFYLITHFHQCQQHYRK